MKDVSKMHFKREVREGITVTEAQYRKAQKLAVELSSTITFDVSGILNSKSLEEIEHGIKQLNEMSDKCWLLSAMALYALIYNQEFFTQSGLSWVEYVDQSLTRLGLEWKEVYEQLSSARFFIKYHDKLIAKGWTPAGSRSKLNYAEIALEKSKNLSKTIDHIVHDTFREFRRWYTSYSEYVLVDAVHKDAVIKHFETRDNSYFIDGIEAVKVSEQIDRKDRIKLNECLNEIFKIMKDGKEIAVIPVEKKSDIEKLKNSLK